MAQLKGQIAGLIAIVVVVDGLQFAGISGRLLLEVAAIIAVIGTAMLFVVFIISDIRNADNSGRSFTAVIIAFLSAIIMAVILI